MKIAIVHDWLVTYAGAERVLEQIIICFPDADLYSVVDFFSDELRAEHLMGKKATTTFIQKLPFAKKKYRNYLSLMPLAIEQLDLSKYDLVISSSHAVAKGVITGPDQVHISYVHSPMRYAWDLQHQYLKAMNLEKGIKSWLVRRLLYKMRIWDLRTVNGVDHFVANSKFIAKRITKTYRRNSTVIYPPVATDDFAFNDNKEDFYLTASRMVPYKRIDLIVRAFTQMPQKKLIVIGDGPEMNKIRKLATNNIELLGTQPFHILRDYMQKAKAFVFAAEEDFGIVPVEAQACGTPVIAYGKGGCLETIKGLSQDKPSGVFFQEQTVDSFINGINEFEENVGLIDPVNCRDNALRFAPDSFRKAFKEFVYENIANRI